MDVSPRHEVFLSYAHADREAAVRLVAWLRSAGVDVWFDRDDHAAGSVLATALPQALSGCRAVVRLLSDRSEQGKLGKQEESLAFLTSIYRQDRPLVPVWIEDRAPELPDFLANLTAIHAPGGRLDSAGALGLLLALNPTPRSSVGERTYDVYVSRPWPAPGRDPAELEAADGVCRTLCDLNVRPIGDAEDQPSYDEGRVRSLIRSCHALIAVVPDRGQGRTSKYFPSEVRLAQESGLPFLVVTVGNPEFPVDLIESSVPGRLVPAEALDAAQVEALLDEARSVDREEHYLFLAMPFRGEQREVWDRARALTERVTGIRCRTGEEFQKPEEIADQIRGAQAVIADISFESEPSSVGSEALESPGPRRGPNSLIEAGIAVGSQRPLHLLNSTSRRRSPFLFRTWTQFKFADEVELLAGVHAYARRYRRRVLC